MPTSYLSIYDIAPIGKTWWHFPEPLEMQPGKLLNLTTVLLVSGFGLFGAPLTVASYSMLNGAHGSFRYRDFTYVPCAWVCDTTFAPLSGGKEKLTDGVSPVVDWEQQRENTSWVGWDAAQGLVNPLVAFNFAQSVTVNSVRIWASNSLSGGVALPAAIVIGGTTFPVPPNPSFTNPQALVFSGLNFTGSSLTVQFNQSGSPWVMIGEVSFDGVNGSGVPEPASLALVACAAPLLYLLRRRANRW